MKSIRVLHVLNSLGSGGIETFIMNIYRNIDRKKLQFDFLLQSKEEQFFEQEILQLGGKIFRITPRKESLILNIKETRAFFANNSYKVAHFHYSSLSDITALYFANKNNISCRIIHSHNVKAGGARIHTYLHQFNKIFLDRLATTYFACSQNAAKWMYTNKIIKGDSFFLIRNAIDIKKFEFNINSRNQIREEFNLQDDCTLLGNVARFHPQKNHLYLLEIFKAYTNINSNSKLILVGTGKLKSDILEKARQLNIEDKIIFTGVRKDVENILSAIDCFVFPSLYEGLGIVLVEAQSNGVPVVAAGNNIPHDVKINENFIFLDLNFSANLWSENIDDLVNQKRAVDVYTKVSTAGYNLKDTISFLENFYVNIK